MESKPILSTNNQTDFASSKTPDNTSISTDELNKKLNIFYKCNTLLQLIKKRYVLSFYMFFGFFVAFLTRANLSVAIVDMSKIVSMTYDSNNATNVKTETSEWSPILQGYILSAFFYGYMVTQIPAAFLTSKYGGKIFFGAGIGVCSFLTLLTPLTAYTGPSGVIVLRVFEGMAQGFIYPSMHCLWSKWAPPSERSRLATFSLSGCYVGSVVALSLGGVIGQYINWHSIFYIFGSAGVLWSLLWFYHISESPSNHHRITSDERLFIESSLPINVDSKIPWSSIFCSTSVWAIVGAHFAENWGFYTFLTEMPTFYSQMLNYKIEKVGLFTSLPYILMAIVLYSSGLISDKLIERKISYTSVRKIFCCSGFLLQSLFMFLLTLSEDGTIIIGCTVLSIGLGGMAWASFGVNHLDIGAGYANVLMAISNTFASIPGIISPVLTGHLIEHKTKVEWNFVFLLASIIFFLGAVIYFVLGSGETRPWANRTKDFEITINTSDITKNDNKVFEPDTAETGVNSVARYENATNKVVINNIKD